MNQEENAVRRKYRGAHVVNGHPYIPYFWINSGKGRRDMMGIPRDSKGRVMGRISEFCHDEESAWKSAFQSLEKEKP